MRQFFSTVSLIIKKIPTIAWNVLCKPKSKGGIVLKHLHLLNQVLLLKIIWNLWTKSNSLLTKVFKSKYYCDWNILEATVAPHQSLAWNWLGQLLPTFRLGLLKPSKIHLSGNHTPRSIHNQVYLPLVTKYAIPAVTSITSVVSPLETPVFSKS